MELIRQSKFSMGEVDPINYNRTESNAYLESAESLKNFFINEMGYPVRRGGSEKSAEVTSEISASDARFFKMVDKNDVNYLLILAATKIYIYDASYTLHTTLTTTYTASDVLELDYTIADEAIVFVHNDYDPARVYISDYSPLTFLYALLDFKIQPSYDFGKINYNDATVTYTGTGTVTFDFATAADVGFTTEWEGGVILGGGNTAEDPIGYGIIETVTPWAAGKTVFVVSEKVAFKVSPGALTGVDFSVKQPVFTAALGFPGAVAFYESRLWFANTKSLKTGIFGSATNAPTNFNVGVGNPTDAVVYSLGETDAGQILYLNSGKQLEVYTDNYEYVVPQDSDEGITPANFSIKKQSSFGSSAVCRPLTYQNNSYYVGRQGNAFIRFAFQGIGEAYASTNVSIAAEHLIKNPMHAVLLQASIASQDNYIFLINDDNSLTVYQFNDTLGINAFTPMVFGQDVQLIDIININNDVLFLKKLTLTDEYILDKFDPTVYLDSYTTKTMATTGVITGLDTYEGYAVTVVFDGQDFGTYTVTNNQITVYNPLEETGSAQIGLIYTSTFIPLNIFNGPEATDAYKKITYAYIDYYKSLNFYINGKLVAYQNFADIQAGLPLAPQTGTARVSAVRGWNIKDNITITQSSPFGLTIQAVSYQVKGELI